MNMEDSIHGESPSAGKISHEAQLLLASIREQYLQAKPPQQIEELKLKEVSLQQKYVHGHVIDEGTKGVFLTSEEDQEDSSIRKQRESAGLTIGTSHDGDKMRRDEDLDGVGNKTKGPKGASTSIKDSGSESCKKRNILDFLSAPPDIPIVMGKLYDSTIGYSQSPLAAASASASPPKEEYYDKDESQAQSFLHPPIQYRIAFAKHIIKQLESGHWSAPQGSHEKDIEDPVEQDEEDEETLLQRWYEGLELLSRSGQALSEPFYRLYEIKVAHHHNEGGSGGEMVKIFENETSFVANGTTGLVTWKASTQFLKWLSTQGTREENGILFTRLDGKEPTRWILELGCGSGLLAIAMTKFMPSTFQQYLATDGSIAALENAKLNMDANFSASSRDKLLKNKIRFERVEWQNEATSESFSQLVDGMTTIYGCETGVLLGADIVFDPELIPDLVRLMLQFLDTKAGRIVISSTIRNASTMQLLKVELDVKGLGIKVCGTWDDGEILEIYLRN